MPVTHKNRLRCTISNTPSTSGALTVSTASSGYRTFAAGDDAKTFDCVFVDGTAWEVRTGCAYTHSGTSLSRGTLEDSSTGSAISLTSATVVTVTATAAFGNSVENALGAWGALSGVNSITGTATALIGRLNVCSGTTADYTVTLPAVSGNAGRYIGFQMAGGLTKLVTLDGNASETIDGALTRVMWALETALLYCDGSTWTKMAGKSVPMFCSTTRNTDKTISSSTETLVEINNIISEAPSGLANTTSGRITVRRESTYIVAGAGVHNIVGPSANNQIYVRKNGTKLSFLGLIPTAATGLPGPTTCFPIKLVTNDYVELGALATVGSTMFADTIQLILTEVTTW